MTEKATSLMPSSQMYSGYPANRMAYNAPQFNHLNNSGLGMTTQNPLGSMHNLKANLPNQAGLDLGGISRPTYNNNPLMVLPSGQTVPLSAFWSQQHGNPSGEQSHQAPYVPTGIFPHFVGSNNIGHASMTAYNWPYGLHGDVPALDPARRGSYSSEDNAGPITPLVGPTGQSEFYNGGFQYMLATSANMPQQYIAGPIQPVKCADNKSYEMVNLDELTQADPPIPRAVPALWTNQEELSLAKCLQNPEGITNIYIRGFMPDTTDEDLQHWASRFGEIESCKAIIEQDTGKCKGFGFVLYYSPAAAENCIRGFFHLGFQASYAQKSRNSRLKDLEDKNSTNIYCTGVPIDWNEADLCKHFLPYHAVSTKICRDAPSGVSKEVGFARFESRDVAERVIRDFHGVLSEHSGVKLYLRFADTKAQKQLKQQSQERRTWRSREYSYSVEHTPSPTLTRLQNLPGHISPKSHGSYQSPAGASTSFTPATSVSPPEIPGVNKIPSITRSTNAWPTHGGLASITNASNLRPQIPLVTVPPIPGVAYKTLNAVPIIPDPRDEAGKTKTPSPQKVTIKVEPASACGKENATLTQHSAE